MACTIKITGILQIAITDRVMIEKIKCMQSSLPVEANWLDSSDLHITLVHQKYIKPNKQKFDKLDLIPPIFELDDKLYMVQRSNKTSWIALVKDQHSMQEYVNSVLESVELPLNPENRVYHASLANLTGNPFHSVGDVSWDDIK